MDETEVSEGDTLVTESWSHTQVKKVKLNHTWTIDDFSKRPEQVGEELESSSFSAGPGSARRWWLQLYPRGQSEEDKHYISIFLYQMQCSKSKPSVSFTLSVLNCEGKLLNKKVSHHVFNEDMIEGYGFPKFIMRETLIGNGVLPNDTFTVFCEMAVVEQSKTICGQNRAVQLKNHEARLPKDLRQLFEDMKFTDVLFTVSGQELRAHKFMLAARSPVFDAMFKTDLEESKTNKVEIKDMDYNVFTEMLRYMYTGKVNDLNKMAGELLKAAEKYELEELKSICENSLCETLNTVNAADYLVLADVYRADRLKGRAIVFINTHASAVKNSPGWQTLYTSHPHLLVEAWMILSSITSSQKKK